MVRSGLALMVGGVLLLSGCDRGSELADVVEQQGDLIAFVSSASDSPRAGMHPEERSTMYRNAIAALEKGIDRAGSGNPGLTAAARTLMAQASIGEAEIAVQEMSDASREAMTLLTVVGSDFRRSIAERALAEGLGSYSPAGDLAELERSASAVQTGVRDDGGRLEELRSALESARTQVDSMMAQAREVRGQATELRDRVSRLDGMDRAEAIEEAVRVGRVADGIEKQAAEKGFEVDRLVREVSEVEAEIAGGERRLGMIESSRQRLQETVANARAQSAEVVLQAEGTTDRAVEELGRVMSVLEERAIPAFEQAESGYRRAIQLAQQAGRDGGVGTTATLASAQHALGTLAGQLVGLGERVLTVVEDLAGDVEMSSAMRPRVEALTSRVEEARAVRDEMLAAAAETLSRIRVPEGQGERLETVVQQLRERTGTSLPEQPDSGEDQEYGDESPEWEDQPVEGDGDSSGM